MYRLTSTLCQPLYLSYFGYPCVHICPILGIHAYRAESRTGGRLVIVLTKLDGRGGRGPPS